MNITFFINEINTREEILHRFCIYNGESPPSTEADRTCVRTFLSDRDTVWSLRHKIAFATKRVFAYQFLYWKSGESRQTYPFRFFIDNVEYNVLSVIESIFDFRHRIHIRPLDHVSITNSGLWNPTENKQIVATINLLDYETIYGNIKLSSEPQMEAFYYNSVIRYWPQFSYQDFVKRMLYGLVSIPSFSINPQVESLIMFDQFETHSEHASTLMTARFMRILPAKISTRILFDIIPTDTETSMLYLKYNNVVYRKIHNYSYRSENVSEHPIEVSSMKNNDLYIIYTSGAFHYSFQSNALMVTHFSSSSSSLTDDSIDETTTRYNNEDNHLEGRSSDYPRISKEMLSDLETGLFKKYEKYENIAQLQKIDTPLYEDYIDTSVDIMLDVVVSWGTQIGYNEFKTVRNLFKLLSESNIVVYDGSTREDSFSIRFVYIGFPTEFMSYTDIQNPTLNKIGHLIKFSNVADSVMFQIMDVTLSAFEFISSFIISFLNSEFKTADSPSSSTNPDADEEEEEEEEGTIAPTEHFGVKRLIAIDPVLYKLPRGQLYSVKCQRGRQPIAYKRYEKKLVDPTIPVYTFRNFTTGDPMYYQCNKKFPILNFRTDLHEDGKCVPCCGTHDKNSGNINSECLRSGRVPADSPMLTEIVDRKKKIILMFNKPLAVGRQSYVNDAIYEILNYKLGKVKRYDKALVIGVEQRTPLLLLNVGFFYSILYLLGEDVIRTVLSRCDPLFRQSIEAVFFHQTHLRSSFFLYVDPSSKTIPEKQPWIVKLIDYIYHVCNITVIQISLNDTVVVPPPPHSDTVLLVVRTDYGVFPVVSNTRKTFLRRSLTIPTMYNTTLSIENISSTFHNDDITWLCNLDYSTPTAIGFEYLMVYGALLNSRFYIPCEARKAEFVTGKKSVAMYPFPDYSFDELRDQVLSKFPTTPLHHGKAVGGPSSVHIKYNHQFIGVIVESLFVPYKRVSDSIVFYAFKEIFYDPFKLNEEMFENVKLNTKTAIKWRNNIYNMLLLERRRTGTDNVIMVPDSDIQNIEIENIYQSCAERPKQMQCDESTKKLKITKTIYDEIKDVTVSTVPNFGIVDDMNFIKRDNEIIHIVSPL